MITGIMANTVKAKTQLREFLERVDDRFMGTPVDIHPHDAILMAMRFAVGEVLYCDAQVARLSEEELFEVPRRQTVAQMTDGHFEVIEEKRDPELISRWIRLRNGAADRAAKYAEMALRCGVEEAKVKIAEQEANLVSRYFETVLSEINLTPDQFKRVGPAMRKNLQLLEANVG